MPEPVPGGAAVVKVVGLAAEVWTDAFILNFRRSFAGTGSKLVPVMVTGVPGVPIEGEKLVIVGAPGLPPAVTVNAALDVAVPTGLVTVIAPVAAPDGTIVTI